MTPIEIHVAWCVALVLVAIIVSVAAVLCTYYDTRHSMKKQMALNSVMHVIDSLNRSTWEYGSAKTVQSLSELMRAANALYDAGHWTLKTRADNHCTNEDEYWTRLRDAMNRKPGSAPPRPEGD